MAKNLIKFKGLIIKEKRIGDNKLIVVLTKELGVISIFCNGVFKPQSKNLGSTQLFSYSDFCVNEKTDPKGNKSYYLESSQPDTIFFKLWTDIHSQALGHYIAELLSYCEIAEGDNSEILRLTLNTFYSLNTERQPLNLLKSIFEIRFLCEIGFRPNMVGCNKCYLYESDSMHINIKTGKVLCDDCITEEDRTNGFDFLFDKNMFYIVRYIILSDYDELFSFKISYKAQKFLTNFSESFVNYYTKDRFKSLDFMKAKMARDFFNTTI